MPVMDLLLGEVPWFPQDYATEFFVAKGMVALVASLLVIGHMAHTWSGVTTLGRRLRYFALLAATSLYASASVEQVEEAELVDFRHLGVIAVLLLVIVAMVVSIREDLRNPSPPGH